MVLQKTQEQRLHYLQVGAHNTLAPLKTHFLAALQYQDFQQKLDEMLVKKYGNPTMKRFYWGDSWDKLTEEEALKLVSKDPNNIRGLTIRQCWLKFDLRDPLILKFSPLDGLCIEYKSEQSFSIWSESHRLQRIRKKKEEEERKAKAAEDF